jgi:hypothetical protein
MLDYISGAVHDPKKYLFQKQQLAKKNTQDTTIAASDDEASDPLLGQNSDKYEALPKGLHASISYRIENEVLYYTFISKEYKEETDIKISLPTSNGIDYTDANIKDLIINDILQKDLAKRKKNDELNDNNQAASNVNEGVLQETTIKKFFELLKILNQLRNRENSSLALYDIQNQIVMFFDTLSAAERNIIFEIKKVYEETFWGEWRNTDLVTMGIDVFFISVSLVAVAVGLAFPSVNPRLTYGFGYNIAEIAGNVAWNVPGTALFNVIQTKQQKERAEHFSMGLNIFSAVGLITLSCIAIAEFAKGNVQFAADLTGWAFAASMLVSCIMDWSNYYHFKRVWKDGISELDEFSKKNTKNASIITQDEFNRLRTEKNLNELAKISGSILVRVRAEIPEQYHEYEQRLNMIIHGKDKAQRHLSLARAWFACFLGMSCLAGALTLAMAPTGGGSLIVWPIINVTTAFLTAVFRGYVTRDALNSTKAKDAIQRRDEFLENVKNDKKYSITISGSSPTENMMDKGIIFIYLEKGDQKYKVKWNNGEIKSGVIPKEIFSNKGENNMNIFNFIASKGGIVRDVNDITPKKSSVIAGVIHYAQELFGKQNKKAKNEEEPRKSTEDSITSIPS